MAATVRYARENKTRERLKPTVRADSLRAIHLYRRAGFTEYGRVRRSMRVRGKYFDMIRMELLL